MDTEATIPSDKEIPDGRAIQHRDGIEKEIAMPAIGRKEQENELTPLPLASIHHELDE